MAVIDWYTRKVLTWELSNTLDSGFCVDGLERVLKAYILMYTSERDAKASKVSVLSFRLAIRIFCNYS